jgi:hypothetical protein
MAARPEITARSIAIGILAAIGAFALLGTVAALWENPFFVRMTPVSGFEVGLLALQAVLLGAYLAIPARGCAIKRAGIGGIANFIGIACPVCNKLLMFAFGADLLLTYLEPARIYLAAGGALITGWAVAVRWRSFMALNAGVAKAEPGRAAPPYPPQLAPLGADATGAARPTDLRSGS